MLDGQIKNKESVNLTDIDNMIDIKSFIKKILPALLVSVFLVALYYAISMHIDGLGIFSIVLAVLLLLYGLYKPHHATAQSEKISNSNVSHTLKFITSPMFLQLAFTLMPAIFRFLERNRDRLDRGKILELENEFKSMLEKLKIDPDLGAETPPETHGTKKH